MEKRVLAGLLAAGICVATATSASTLYVSKARGDNKNPGTRERPVQELDRAIALAQPGDEIKVAGGTYSGTFGVGYLESDKPIQLFGSYDESFARRDLRKTPTLFQPDNAAGGKARKPLLRFTKAVDGTVVDGIVFDMGMRNAYSPREGLVPGVETGRLLGETERPPSGNSTVEEPILQIASAARGGTVHIQNCIFLNGASFAIQAGMRSGTLRVLNNVFVGNRMAAVEAFGTCPATGGPKSLPRCAEVEIAYNTLLFTWSRQKDFKDMGYGVRVMTKCAFNIHHNVIGGSALAGIDHSRFNRDEWVSIDDNVFFVNKKADLEYSPASNTHLDLFVAQFKDLQIASAKGNRAGIPPGLKVDKAYLEGFLDARYTEKVDYDPNSPANQWRELLGLNKQGKISSQATMFANRYPWKEALSLFGAVPGCGAQMPR